MDKVFYTNYLRRAKMSIHQLLNIKSLYAGYFSGSSVLLTCRAGYHGLARGYLVHSARVIA